jgi:RES domain-containing protein
MKAFRIADRRYPIFDGIGARLLGGRWNSPGVEVIYASETFAGAILEVLVHANLGRLPRTHACVEITIPANLAVETVTSIPTDQQTSRDFGDLWVKERRTAVLFVPSIVTGERERNLVISPAHPAFSRITASDPFEVSWDARLFKRPQ